MNPKYKQLENEDSYEYGLRLIEIKVEQNPSDLEWSDIVDLLGLDVHYECNAAFWLSCDEILQAESYARSRKCIS